MNSARLAYIYYAWLNEYSSRVFTARLHSPDSFNYYDPYWAWLSFGGRL